MEWKDEYAIGIKEIDAQHKELISLFSRVTDAVAQSLPWSDIHFRVLEVKNFAAFHFEFEEALMRLFGYPQTDDHSNGHKQFVAKMNEIEKSSIADDVKQEVVTFLVKWLFDHILKSDRAYAQYILAGASVARS